MRCAQCSFQLPDTAKFCPSCGAPVPVAVPMTENTATTSERRTGPPPAPRSTSQAPLPTSPWAQNAQARLAPLLRQGKGVVAARENRDYVLAGAGALVALLAFVFIPYVSVTEIVGGFGASGSLSGPSLAGGTSVPLLAGSLSLGANAMLWLVPLCALAALAVAGLLAYKSTRVSALTPRTGAVALLVTGGLGALALIWFALSFGHTVGGLSIQGLISLNGSLALGFWLSLLGMVGIAVAGWRAWQREQHTLGHHATL